MAKAGTVKTQPRKTVKRQKRTPWLRSVGEAFLDILDAEGGEKKDVPADPPQITNFKQGDGIHLALLQGWCEQAGIELDDVFLAAMLKRLRTSFPVPVSVHSEVQQLKELAPMLRDPEKARVLSYLQDMDGEETKAMIAKAHELWAKRSQSSNGRALPGP